MVALAVTAAVAALAMPSSALAGPTSPNTAIVSLGDSYISGEAGRWQGNSINASGNRNEFERFDGASEGPEFYYGWSTLWPSDSPMTL